MLLDICEPGQTPLPHAENLAVGIDLGTTYCVVAISSEGNAEVIRDFHGNALIPSVVHYADNGTVTVGSGHAQAIHSIKRRMGHASETLLAGGRELTPVEVSADILRHIKRTAEASLGKTITQAVITVPAYFDDSARQATKDAAQLAGLEVLRLVNEPTAAALAYGLDNASEGLYAIYDLGGGTFDISLLRMEKGIFQVLATGGDTALGGDDFDQALARHVFEPKTAARPLLPEEITTLHLKARKAKETLSSEPSVELEGMSVTVNTFNTLITPMIDRSIAICEAAMEDAGLKTSDIQGVVLVGGSTRIPLVRDKVEAFFGRAPLTNVNPDEVVAIGAAVQAEGLTQGSDNLLLDVIPLSLGLETMGGLVEKIVHRNTPIPVAVSQEFTTYKDGQNAMQIHVLQGEREMADQCRSLARFELTGIPPMVAGIARIAVTFTVDADGLLTVSAREETTGTQQHIEVKPSYGLAPEQIESMLRESMVHAKEDIMQRLLAEAKMEAGRSILELESAMRTDGSLLNDVETLAILKQIGILKQAVSGTDRDAIDYEVEQLHHTAREFAERRMDSAIGHALKGIHVSQVENS